MEVDQESGQVKKCANLVPLRISNPQSLVFLYVYFGEIMYIENRKQDIFVKVFRFVCALVGGKNFLGSPL